MFIWLHHVNLVSQKEHAVMYQLVLMSEAQEEDKGELQKALIIDF